MKLKTARNLHRELNVILFDGQLSMPIMLGSRNKRMWAALEAHWLEDDTIKTYLHVTKALKNNFWGRCIFAHEMVHQYQAEILGEAPNHGLTFWAWYDTFKVHGLELVQTY